MTRPVPDGFAPHQRKSPLTAPWEPIYARTTDTAVILGLYIAEAHTNSRGMAHGGLITALADNAMGLSCSVMRGEGTRLVTASLGVDFIGPAAIGQWLTIEPEVIRAGGTLCFAQCLIKADDVVCARASGVFSLWKPKA
jgi:uncharacterized protein (TIGR00369 family)